MDKKQRNIIKKITLEDINNYHSILVKIGQENNLDQECLMDEIAGLVRFDIKTIECESTFSDEINEINKKKNRDHKFRINIWEDKYSLDLGKQYFTYKEFLTILEGIESLDDRIDLIELVIKHKLYQHLTENLVPFENFSYPYGWKIVTSWHPTDIEALKQYLNSIKEKSIVEKNPSLHIANRKSEFLQECYMDGIDLLEIGYALIEANKIKVSKKDNFMKELTAFFGCPIQDPKGDMSHAIHDADGGERSTTLFKDLDLVFDQYVKELRKRKKDREY